ncbi:MAG: hypothetical protein ACLGIO_06635 [Acidimicrobiia bacterium]
MISAEGAYELERDAAGATVERPCRVRRPEAAGPGRLVIARP